MKLARVLSPEIHEGTGKVKGDERVKKGEGRMEE